MKWDILDQTRGQWIQQKWNEMEWNGMYCLFGYKSVCASVRTFSLFASFHAYNTFRAYNTVCVYNLFHEDLEGPTPFPSTPREMYIGTYFLARVYTNMEWNGMKWDILDQTRGQWIQQKWNEMEGNGMVF